MAMVTPLPPPLISARPGVASVAAASCGCTPHPPDFNDRSNPDSPHRPPTSPDTSPSARLSARAPVPVPVLQPASVYVTHSPQPQPEPMSPGSQHYHFSSPASAAYRPTAPVSAPPAPIVSPLTAESQQPQPIPPSASAEQNRSSSPSGPLILRHKLLVLLGCLTCLVASTGLSAGTMGSSSLYLVTASWSVFSNNNQSAVNTASSTSYVGPFSYQLCAAWPSYCTSVKSGDVFAGQGSTQWGAVRAFVALSFVAVVASTLVLAARVVHFLKPHKPQPYSPIWDLVLFALLSLTLVIHFLATLLVASFDAAPAGTWAGAGSGVTESAPSSTLGPTFALLAAAFVLSVLVLLVYSVAYARGTLRRIYLESAVQREVVAAEQAKESGFWASHPAHKVFLALACLASLASTALLGAVLGSTDLYAATISIGSSYSSVAIGPWQYSFCSGSYYCQSSGGSAWDKGISQWVAVQAVLVLACVLCALSGVGLVARAVRYTTARCLPRPYSARWDRWLLALLCLSAAWQLADLVVIRQLDVSSLLIGSDLDWQFNGDVTYSVGSSWPLLLCAFVWSLLVALWFAAALNCGVLRGMVKPHSAWANGCGGFWGHPSAAVVTEAKPTFIQQQTINIVLTGAGLGETGGGGGGGGGAGEGLSALLQAQLAAIQTAFPHANFTFNSSNAAQPIQQGQEYETTQLPRVGLETSPYAPAAGVGSPGDQARPMPSAPWPEPQQQEPQQHEQYSQYREQYSPRYPQLQPSSDVPVALPASNSGSSGTWQAETGEEKADDRAVHEYSPNSTGEYRPEGQSPRYPSNNRQHQHSISANDFR